MPTRPMKSLACPGPQTFNPLSAPLPAWLAWLRRGLWSRRLETHDLPPPPPLPLSLATALFLDLPDPTPCLSLLPSPPPSMAHFCFSLFSLQRTDPACRHSIEYSTGRGTRHRNAEEALQCHEEGDGDEGHVAVLPPGAV